jgi:hypothetical protein
MSTCRLAPYPVLGEAMAEEMGTACELFFSSQGPDPGAVGSWSEQFTLGTDSSWNADYHDLCLTCNVTLKNVSVLFGETGVAPEDAELMIALEWTSTENCLRYLGAGVVLTSGAVLNEVTLSLHFSPGELRGIGYVTVELFLKAPSPVRTDSARFASTPGARLGSLGPGCKVIVDGDSSLFPIVEDDLTRSGPLWLFRREWDDPFEEEFSVNSLSLVLNKSHEDFHLLGLNEGTQKWTPLMRQVLASWIVAVLLEVCDNASTDVHGDISSWGQVAIEGSIAQFVCYVYSRADLDVSSFEELSPKVQIWIDKVLGNLSSQVE